MPQTLLERAYSALSPMDECRVEVMGDLKAVPANSVQPQETCCNLAMLQIG